MARRKRKKKSGSARSRRRLGRALRSGPPALLLALLLFVVLGWSAAHGAGGGAFGALARGVAWPFQWLAGATALSIPLMLALMGVLQLIGKTPARRRPWFVRSLLTPVLAAAVGGALALLAAGGAPWGGALGKAIAASFGGVMGRWLGGLLAGVLFVGLLLVLWGASPWRWFDEDRWLGRTLRRVFERPEEDVVALAPDKTPAKPTRTSEVAPGSNATLDLAPVSVPLPEPARDEPLDVALLPEAPSQDACIRDLEAGLEALGADVQRVIEETTGVALEPADPPATLGLSALRFTFGKAPGQKTSVRKVDQAAADLGVETGRAPVRIHVKDTIAVELPLSAAERRFAPIRPLLEDVGVPAGSGVSYLIGRRHDGRPFELDVRLAKHILVGGATGGGKTVCLHALIFGLVFRHPPSAVRLCLHDPKLVGFHRYAGLPHLWHPVVSSAPELRQLEDHLWEELQRRKEAMVADPAARFPVIVTVLDEFSNPSDTLTRLIAEARAFDMFFVLATQHPLADVIPTPIKANLTTGIAFRVRDASASRLIVGVSDAAALLPHGDALVQSPEALSRVQAAWVRDEDLAALAASLGE